MQALQSLKMHVQDQIPVTILTGFLGSGKTTLLNHLLEENESRTRFAIIENEFGEVGVDDKVIKEGPTDEMLEVINGCICCTVRSDLSAALKRLSTRRNDFDAVIIETTGLANPAPVAQTFFLDKDVKSSFRLDGIITVVDAKHVLERFNEEKPGGIKNESIEQVAFADCVLLNKCDLVEEQEIEEVTKALRAINANAEIMNSMYGRVECSKLLNIEAFSLEKIMRMEPHFLTTSYHHDVSVSSVSIQFPGELNHQQLRIWLDDLVKSCGSNLFRYKGILAVKGMPTKFVFQGVHMSIHGRFEESFAWQSGETRECRLVFIGRSLDKASLEKGVMACRDGDLRFRVGDEVETSCNGWSVGRVVRVWHDGHPYCIKLKDGEEVWPPVDSDQYVRKPVLPQPEHTKERWPCMAWCSKALAVQ